MSAAEKAAAEADRRLQETYLNNGALSSSAVADAKAYWPLKMWRRIGSGKAWRGR